MTAILEAEASRLVQQERLDRRKTAKERNKWGQFATPPVLSLDIARFAWDKLKHRSGRFTFLDPAIGTGSFFGAFRQVFPEDRVEAATGVELDGPFAEAASTVWHGQGLRVIRGDFTKQTPEPVYNVILTNPPYVRHHHLAAAEKQRLGDVAEGITGLRLSGLAGLYCYFLLIAHAWLAENGLAAWLIPSEFMDVNYGDQIKRYLTERVSLLQIHRFRPADVQFDDALVSSAIVIFEKHGPKPGHDVVFSAGGTLTEPASLGKVSLDDLRATKKWTLLPRQGGNGQCGTNGHCADAVTLGDLFLVKRGIATGSNKFFIVPRTKLKELGIPLSCVRPILPSARFLKQDVIEAEADGWPALDRQLALIDCELGEEEIGRRWPRFAEYLHTGRKQRIHEGYLTSRRCPWYSQEKRAPALFVFSYMGRSLERPFRFILNRSQATVANAYHLLYPRAHIAGKLAAKAEEIFEALRAIRPEQFFSESRVYGGGLHKMEPAEVMRLPAGRLAKILQVTAQRQQALF